MAPTQPEPATVPRLTRVQPGPVSVGARIAALEHELNTLREQQRAELKAAIVLDVGANVVFSAAELWAHRVVSRRLATAFAEAGIHNARQLGKRLRALGLERLGADEHGALWMCG